MGCRSSQTEENEFIFAFNNDYMWERHLSPRQITALKTKANQIKKQIDNLSCCDGCCCCCENSIIKATQPMGQAGAEKGAIYKRLQYFYYGQIKNNKFNGKGIRLMFDKTVYNGSFKDGKAHGKGKYYTDEANLTFEGSWDEGEMIEGKFVEQNIRIKKNDEVQKTQYEIIFSDDVTYSGQAKINSSEVILEGEGTLIQKNLNYKYKGSWKNNRKEGKGVATYANGYKYDGQFHNNRKHGEGKFTISGDCYVQGKWQNDQLREGTVHENGQSFPYQPNQ